MASTSVHPKMGLAACAVRPFHPHLAAGKRCSSPCWWHGWSSLTSRNAMFLQFVFKLLCSILFHHSKVQSPELFYVVFFVLMAISNHWIPLEVSILEELSVVKLIRLSMGRHQRWIDAPWRLCEQQELRSQLWPQLTVTAEWQWHGGSTKIVVEVQLMLLHGSTNHNQQNYGCGSDQPSTIADKSAVPIEEQEPTACT